MYALCVHLLVYSTCSNNTFRFDGFFSHRDVSGPQTLRIMDLQVSKHHCEIRYLRRRESFAVTDLGSQNGTYLNGERISEVKYKYILYMLDIQKYTVHAQYHYTSTVQCSSTFILSSQL